MLTHGISPDFRGGVHLSISPSARSVQSRVDQVRQLRTDGVHCRESAGTGPVLVLKVVPVTDAAFSGFTMDQLVYTPLFSFPRPLLVRVRSGYRVLKVPANYQQSNQLRVFSKPFYERCHFMTFEPTLCSSDFFLSSRPRTGFATTYINGYG